MMVIVVFCALLGYAAVASQHLGRYHFHGKVKFAGGRPKSLPPKSHLTVKVSETSMADAPSVHIAETELPLVDFEERHSLKYSITVPAGEVKGYGGEPAMEVAISAILNVGWQSTGDNKERIKKGDYFTDTLFGHRMVNGKRNYEQDIYLVRAIR